MNKELFKENVYKKYENLQYRKINSHKNKFLQIVASLVIVILGTTGVVFASVKIYNNYISKQDKFESRGLFDTGDGITTYETDLMANDMTWNAEPRLYHKIITNMEEYNKYKSRIPEIPDMSESDFESNFLVIVANENIRQNLEKDLIISDVYVDSETTKIIMKQRENPDYNNDCNIWYAVVDNSQLRDNVKVEIAYKDIDMDDIVNIKDISVNYDIEAAKKDNCLIVENNKIISDNEGAIDDFMKNAEEGKDEFIRIYSKYDNQIIVKDVRYENQIYYVYKCSFIFGEGESKKNYYNSYTDLKRYENKKDFRITYSLEDEESDRSETILILE